MGESKELPRPVRVPTAEVTEPEERDSFEQERDALAARVRELVAERDALAQRLEALRSGIVKIMTGATQA